jgi:hypothetical protein
MSMGYDPLIRTLIKYEKVDMIIEWETGLKVIGKLDTVFETDNGLDDDNVNYIEFHAVVFQVNHILMQPTNKDDSLYNWLIEKKGKLIEVSLYVDPPSAIYLTNGQCVWRDTD